MSVFIGSARRGHIGYHYSATVAAQRVFKKASEF